MSLKDNMDPRMEELLPFYVLDALTQEEKEQVEAYLAEHPEARAQMQELQSGASALPFAVSPVEPPQHVKEALMARVQADARLSEDSPARGPSSARPSPQPARGGLNFESIFRVLSLGAAAAAILWAFVLNAQVRQLQERVSSLTDQVTEQSDVINGQVKQLQERVSSLTDQVTEQSDVINDLIQHLPQAQPSDVITVSLKSTEAQPRVLGQLIADPNDKSAVMLISGLPPLEPGKTYQVWLIGNAPVSAGFLTVDENGQSVLIVTSEEAISSFNAVGISIEPAGGSPEPTEVVVLSEL